MEYKKQMSKEEFLNGLQMSLREELPQGKVLYHVRYYQDYIEAQVRGGRTEDEVIAELGAPQLIAKTLIDTDDSNVQNTYDEDYEVTYDREEESCVQNPYIKKRTYKMDITTWYGKLLVILTAIAFIVLLLFVIGTVVPIIIIVCLVMYIISVIKKRR